MNEAIMMGLHSLADRIAFTRLGDWEVRRHAEGIHGYFAPRGFLHLQLWHTAARISILTPSRLTNERFEIWRSGVRIAVRWWEEVAEHVTEVPLPGTAELTALCGWTVARDSSAAGHTTQLRKAGR